MHEETRSILVGAAAGITDVERYGEFRQDIDRLDERRDALAFIAGARHLTLRLDPDDEVASKCGPMVAAVSPSSCADDDQSGPAVRSTQ
jgi:hypothetical protein